MCKSNIVYKSKDRYNVVVELAAEQSGPVDLGGDEPVQ